jgi:hypothetical protein
LGFFFSIFPSRHAPRPRLGAILANMFDGLQKTCTLIHHKRLTMREFLIRLQKSSGNAVAELKERQKEER